ncbi:putative fungal specific transcription factor [Aspergillus nomiae NRRL 13137]|uniref:Putative fungal specific transcription factor n=1 Tax=Aspergillus nomiae NRRL (strain ATCC 15546 / NRRL 13137 / CBS 260.88 / M93) TaxID=1509407 RepID=A0A0L1JDC0_ASPN3|nr:putative fungal specific transcription factor [Aspergillus nomiae NRRL 13137]KNG89707.1 putative fungal specific transcription factor [Aspergillus nomiae NRRL 13137]
MQSESPTHSYTTSEPPRKKRAKYTQVACNECKRRKLKCSGEPTCSRCARDGVPCVYTPSAYAPSNPTTSMEEPNDEGVSARFQSVDRQIESLQHEMRAMAARLRELESSSPANSSANKPPPRPASIVSSQATNTGLQRMMNRPMSPYHVGPTSAEFGLTARRKPLEDDDEFESTAAPSPVAAPDADIATDDPLGNLGLTEALRLVTVYENTVGLMYPCVDLDSVRACIVDFFRDDSRQILSSEQQDWFFARDVEVLKIILAIALLTESHGRSERAAVLAESVEDRFATRVNIPEVDMKELLILTLLSIFHSYRDDEVISWRCIGMACRGSMQLGLHCQETWYRTGGVFPGELQWMWASRLFWCIYVLDRRWSFGTGLPFAIQDTDMDTNLPVPGTATPYLTCMISYAQLSGKIWGLVVGWGSRSRAATSDYCSYLDFQVQQWIQSIPQELRFDPSRPSSPDAVQNDNMMMLQVLLALQANQLRILVYRQNLLSSESIETNVSGASVAVETAKSTIHMLDYFTRVSDIYFQRPEPFNYFLISALAALFLAVFHAPSRFSNVCRAEFYAAVDMVRKSSTRARTSRRLQKIIRSLKLIKLNVGKSPYKHGQPPENLGKVLSRFSHGQHDSNQSSLPQSPLAPSHQHQPSGIPTPQPSASLWSVSSPLATAPVNYGNNDDSCDDLTSFFEMAGGLYFDPKTGPPEEAPAADGASAGVEGIDAFHAENEALTRVMAGLL